MSDTSSSPEVPHRKSLWIPGIFIGAFILLFIAEFFMVRQALDSWNGLVTEKSFVTGTKHNETIEFNKKLKDIGWQGQMSATPLNKNKESDLLLHLKNNQNLPVSDAIVKIRFHRPTHEGYDFTETLTHQGQGIYRGQAVLPLTGVWDMKISAWQKQHDLSEEDNQVTEFLSFYKLQRKYFRPTSK